MKQHGLDELVQVAPLSTIDIDNWFLQQTHWGMERFFLADRTIIEI